MAAEDQEVSITPLLRRIWPSPAQENVTAGEIAIAISHIFTNRLSAVQTGALLTALHFTGWDRRADVIAQCAAVMRAAASPVDQESLYETLKRRGRVEGNYGGRVCDIVGTGGDRHNTFNVSTAASLVCSALLMVGKHGNRAATSSSGSADVLTHASQPSPAILAVTPATLSAMYERSNYAFLYAPVFHHGMRFVAPIRRALGWRTIFNLLGPLTNPVEASSSAQSERGPHAPQRPSLLEARVVGIARRDLGPVFAEALQMAGARKALVVCGDEDLDEISCAGITHCWLVQASGIANFTLHPADFGLPTHSLSTVSPAPDPDAPGAATNAAILRRLLHDELEMDDPIACFVLLNAAALFVVSGICEADSSAMGAGDDAVVLTERGPGGQRWKEGVRRARWAIRSGRALDMWRRYVDCSLELAKLLPTE